MAHRSAGRLARNVVLTGKVLLNGKKRRLDYGVVVSMQIICPSCMRFIPNFEVLSCVLAKENPQLRTMSLFVLFLASILLIDSYSIQFELNLPQARSLG